MDSARVLGITGGVLGALTGALFFVLNLDTTQKYYAGYYLENVGPIPLDIVREIVRFRVKEIYQEL
jgi:hypothetical protein